METPPLETRTCKHHGEQPISEYYVYHTTEKGKPRTVYTCKLCKSKITKRKYQSEKDWRLPYGREWRKGNKSRTKEYKLQQRNMLKEYVASYLRENPCTDCGETDTRTLEFDHVRGKKRTNISHMICGGYGLESLKEEIAKCAVRCANCHRKKTVEEYGFYRSYKKS